MSILLSVELFKVRVSYNPKPFQWMHLGLRPVTRRVASQCECRGAPAWVTLTPTCINTVLFSSFYPDMIFGTMNFKLSYFWNQIINWHYGVKCNMGYPSDTRVKLTPRELSFVYVIFLSRPIVSEFRTRHVILLCDVHNLKRLTDAVDE